MKFIPSAPVLAWTSHAREKMRHYQLAESRVKRVIAHPNRCEEGVAPRTIAVMQPVTKGKKTTQEIWVMYQDTAVQHAGHSDTTDHPIVRTVISCWRYPGESPARSAIPIPDDIRRELGLSDG